MMNKGVFGRQMFKYGGHVKMQDGGSVPQGPMPTDQGPMLDPEMAALAEGAMEQGVDPQMVQDELAGYAGQFEQMDQAEDYESAINAIRGDDLPIEDRYAELAELVGPEDAQSTPESVLTLVQPVIQMAEIDQGIGGLAAGQMEDVAVEGPMSQGIMSTVNLGADEEAAPPANFNQGGVVPPVRHYFNGGEVSPIMPGSEQDALDPLKTNPALQSYYETNLSQPSGNLNQQDSDYISGLKQAQLQFPEMKAPIMPGSEQAALDPSSKVAPTPMDVKPISIKKDKKDATGLKNSLNNVDTALKAATKDSGDEELKKYMKRYEDILMDDESIKKNLKENKDMAKAQMLFGLAEGFFKFGSTPRKGGQSSLQVLMQSMAPAIQNASQQVAVLQAQKQKIEDRQMQIKLAALQAFDKRKAGQPSTVEQMLKLAQLNQAIEKNEKSKRDKDQSEQLRREVNTTISNEDKALKNSSDVVQALLKNKRSSGQAYSLMLGNLLTKVQTLKEKIGFDDPEDFKNLAIDVSDGNKKVQGDALTFMRGVVPIERKVRSVLSQYRNQNQGAVKSSAELEKFIKGSDVILKAGSKENAKRKVDVLLKEFESIYAREAKFFNDNTRNLPDSSSKLINDKRAFLNNLRNAAVDLNVLSQVLDVSTQTGKQQDLLKDGGEFEASYDQASYDQAFQKAIEKGN